MSLFEYVKLEVRDTPTTLQVDNRSPRSICIRLDADVDLPAQFHVDTSRWNIESQTLTRSGRMLFCDMSILNKIVWCEIIHAIAPGVGYVLYEGVASRS